MPTGSRSVVSEVFLWQTDPNLKASSTDENSMVKNQQEKSRGSAVAQKEFVWESSGRFIEAVKRAAKPGEGQQVY
jgi:hypothetical protein